MFDHIRNIAISKPILEENEIFQVVSFKFYREVTQDVSPQIDDDFVSAFGKELCEKMKKVKECYDPTASNLKELLNIMNK